MADDREQKSEGGGLRADDGGRKTASR